ncbi:fructosamine kinase family protein [Rubrobacter indicoceani]|uniref:fructosamine kinase family protein n=1 Tax=Rubrobacter indicoceani TaxID=2051957 RepID=UPI001F08D8F6|nr:fructosamine kinase family protein [Rubrobacter indicoceani]
MKSPPEPLLARRVEAATGCRIAASEPLYGGMIGEVHRVRFDDGSLAVAKLDRTGEADLEPEGYMLLYLQVHSDLPVPGVLHSSGDLLLVEFVEGESAFPGGAERHAAELLAGLHGVTGEHFGHERDTLIGSLRQPNPQSDSWVEFFREHRLLHFAGVAHGAGRLPTEVRGRVEDLAGRLREFIAEPERPSLVHGDVWAQNVLAKDGRITAFIDPAIYHADPEMELAYISLFDSFGDEFFRRYNELRPVPPEFYSVRRHVYALYPLLVHAYFFGGGYAGMIERTLSRLGV